MNCPQTPEVEESSIEITFDSNRIRLIDDSFLREVLTMLANAGTSLVEITLPNNGMYTLYISFIHLASPTNIVFNSTKALQRIQDACPSLRIVRNL